MFNILKEIVSASSVLTSLEKAKELDEYDTITFGLETDEGEVIKVYVQADQADAFEQKLSALLGKEDNIEAALNELAKEFNIVDVIWPDEDKSVKPDDEKTEDELDISDGSESMTSFADEEPDQREHKIKKEARTIGQRFTSRVLSEADSDASDDEIEITTGGKIKFSNGLQKLAYDTIIMLGIPDSLVVAKRSTFLPIIRSAAVKLLHDTRVRNLLTRLRSEMLQSGVARVTESELESQLSTIYSRRVLAILEYLGIDESIIKMRQTIIKRNIRELSLRLFELPRIRFIINQLVARINAEMEDELKDESAPESA